jgi:hypothetical protein
VARGSGGLGIDERGRGETGTGRQPMFVGRNGDGTTTDVCFQNKRLGGAGREREKRRVGVGPSASVRRREMEERGTLARRSVAAPGRRAQAVLLSPNRGVRRDAGDAMRCDW